MDRHSKSFLGLLAVVALLSARAEADAGVITDWNALAQQNIGGAPFSQVRQYAMVHVAMADAVVAIQGGYQPFRVAVWAPSGASAEAAAAQAAHDVLSFLNPGAAATFDAALAESLASIPPGRRATGVHVGKAVAAAVIAWRDADGFATANPQPPDYLVSGLPGIWQPTASGAGQFSRLGDVEPFALLSATQYLPAAPPQMESSQYAEDFAEVREKGPAAGSTRVLAETRAAQLWASAGAFANVTNPFRLWNNVARDLALADSLSLVQTARLFALLTVSIHDSIQTSQTSKFAYRLWRPETAIAHADIDGNPATVADNGWTPLLTTPPYPGHAGNMSCIGAGAARMLANVFGTDARSFTAAWYSGAATVVHAEDYQSFWALAENAADSRIWGGIHFRFESEASQAACSRVADFIFENRMRPL
jgi:hypothetical protein